MGDVENERYLANPRLCIDCGGPPSAGRPRCTTCHQHRHDNQLKGETE